MPSTLVNEDQHMADAPQPREDPAESGGDSFLDFNDQRIRVVRRQSFQLS